MIDRFKMDISLWAEKLSSWFVKTSFFLYMLCFQHCHIYYFLISLPSLSFNKLWKYRYCVFATEFFKWIQKKIQLPYFTQNNNTWDHKTMTAYWGGQLFWQDKPHQFPCATLGTENSVEKLNKIATPIAISTSGFKWRLGYWPFYYCKHVERRPWVLLESY